MKGTIKTNAEELRDRQAPLYARFPGQTREQPAYFQIHPQTRTLTADYSGELGGAIPESVWHGRILRMTVSTLLTGEAVARLLEDTEVLRLVAAICAGHSIDYDARGNLRGELTEAAADALADLGDYLDRWPDPDRDLIRPWCFGDWISRWDFDQLRGLDDRAVDRLAVKLRAEAVSDGVYLEEDHAYIVDYLLRARDDLDAEGDPCPTCRASAQGGRQAPRFDGGRNRWMVYQGGWTVCPTCDGRGWLATTPEPA